MTSPLSSSLPQQALRQGYGNSPCSMEIIAYANWAPRPHRHSNHWVSSPFGTSLGSVAWVFCSSSQPKQAGVGKPPAGDLTAANGRQVGCPLTKVPSGAQTCQTACLFLLCKSGSSTLQRGQPLLLFFSFFLGYANPTMG